MIWVYGFLTLLLWMWPRIVLWQERSLSETDLVAISPNFTGINVRYLTHIWVSTLSAIFLLVVGFGVVPLVIGIEAWQPDMAYAGGAFAVIAFWEARFALKNGVYPSSKYFGSKTLYVYSERSKLRRVAAVSQVISGAGVVGALAYIVFTLAYHARG